MHWTCRFSSLATPLLALSLACGDDGGAGEGTAETDATTTSTGSSGSTGGGDGETDTEASTGGTTIDEPEPEVDWVQLDCDALVPSYCAYPFPNNVFTVADDATPSGRRLALSEAMMPTSVEDVRPDRNAWSTRDGFSLGSVMMVHLPGATETGLPLPGNIAASMNDDSPTVVLDADSGQRVPHFAELERVDDADAATLFIRPASALAPNRRYIVALRNVVDAAGAPLPAAEAFAALRDLTPADPELGVEERRPLYADIFARLGDAGVQRETLQLAWDFTTASDANNTDYLVNMRDEALAEVGDAPGFEVLEVSEDFDPRVAYRIDGRFDVPLFLDVPGPVSVLNLGADGLPEATGTAQFRFTMLIPASASDKNPAALLQFGHGLLGGRQEIERDHFLDFMDTYGYALYATDWIGLSAPDEAFLGVIFDSGNIHEYEGQFARTQQALINALVLNRVATGTIAADETYGPLLDASQNYYYGISLGGILGTVYMALSTDVTRGAADVMGSPFATLLTRSRQFDPFFAIANSTYDDPRDVQLALALTQNFWDRSEPVGFLSHVRDDPFEGSPQHELMMRAAVGDHSVATVAAHFQARSLAAPHVESGVREVYGLDPVTETEGLGYIEYDFGLPPEPACPVPMRLCDDPHGALRGLPAADEQLDRFLRTGEIVNTCPDGTCSFPELSGCEGGEEDTDLCTP
ncbi:MAG: Ig-like domain-containing protein [Nannocystaceae bacterium]|nr:hypothetical protein [bacterium]